MKHIFLILFLIITFNLSSQTQSGNLVNIHELTTAQINALTTLDQGMLVFNTDSLNLFFYDGTVWQPCKSAKIESMSFSNTTGVLTVIESGKTFTSKLDNKVPITLSGAAMSWDYNLGYNSSTTLTANSTLALSNVPPGSYGTIVVKQDATGNRTLTLPANSKITCSTGAIANITKTPNATSILSFYYDGTTYYWTCGQNFN